jgi:hypothetical protein
MASPQQMALAKALRGGGGMSMPASAPTGGGMEQPPMQEGGMDPAEEQNAVSAMEELKGIAAQAGVDVNNASPEEIAHGAWKVSPTDGVGEAIERSAKVLGFRPPLEGQQGEPEAQFLSPDGGTHGAQQQPGMAPSATGGPDQYMQMLAKQLRGSR